MAGLMDGDMFCLHCQKLVKPRIKWLVDVIVWLCPLCGNYLDSDFTDEDDE